MGTGKTRTALELAYSRLEKGKVEHIIWLCPCSCKETLKNEFEKHIGVREPEAITICGIQTLSTSVKSNSHLLTLVQEKKCFLIVDESNMVKNGKAKRTTNITRIAEKCQYKLILNGTPITRNEADLFAQWYILDWRILGYKGYYAFAANHLEFDDKTHRIRNVLNVDYLVQKIAPYSYQVKKSECLDLPEKTYKTEYFSLSKEQSQHYDEVADELLFDILQDESNELNIYRLFNALQAIISGYSLRIEEHIKKEPFFDDFKQNPRMKLFMDIIDNIYGNKTIIFCEYSDEIEMIKKWLNEEYGIGTAVTFYGKDSIKRRDKNLETFKQDAMFLITNKDCGAYGLNLQFCSYAIYYSNDWDFGTRQQSEDRLHRLGQKNNVHIIDICAEHTLDERILACLRRKENLVEWFKKELAEVKDKKEFTSKLLSLKE